MSGALQSVLVCQPGALVSSVTVGAATVKCTTADGQAGRPVSVQAYLLDATPDQTGGVDVNVTADIFIGAALVLCLALGWIAGGQR